MTPSARSGEELDRAVRRLEDRHEIAEVIARFAMAADDRDFATVRELIADDAVWELNDGELVRGAEAVVEHLRNRMAGMTVTVHTPHNHVLTFEGDDHAGGIVAAHAEVGVGEAAIVAAVRYLDRYVRGGEGWRIQRRRASFLYAMPLSDLPSGLATPLRVRWPGREPEPADLPESLETYRAAQQP